MPVQRRRLVIGHNALVFDLFVYDVLIFCLIFPYDIPHLLWAIGGIRRPGSPVGRSGSRRIRAAAKHLQEYYTTECQHGNRRKLAVFQNFFLPFRLSGLPAPFWRAGSGPFLPSTATGQSPRPRWQRCPDPRPLSTGPHSRHQLSGTFQSHIHGSGLAALRWRSQAAPDCLSIAVHFQVAVAQPCHLARTSAPSARWSGTHQNDDGGAACHQLLHPLFAFSAGTGSRPPSTSSAIRIIGPVMVAMAKTDARHMPEGSFQRYIQEVLRLAELRSPVELLVQILGREPQHRAVEVDHFSRAVRSISPPSSMSGAMVR